MGLNGCPIVIPGRHDCKQLKWLFCGQFNDLHLAFAQSTQKENKSVFSSTTPLADQSGHLLLLLPTDHLARHPSQSWKRPVNIPKRCDHVIVKKQLSKLTNLNSFVGEHWRYDQQTPQNAKQVTKPSGILSRANRSFAVDWQTTTRIAIHQRP